MKLFKVKDKYFPNKNAAKTYRNKLLGDWTPEKPGQRPPVVVERGPDHWKEQ